MCKIVRRLCTRNLRRQKREKRAENRKQFCYGYAGSLSDEKDYDDD